MRDKSCIKVWDPFVRTFHWALVAGFFTAYITEDDWLNLHVWAGYLVFSLVILRLLWGFVGSRHARFSDFVTRPAVIKNYLKDLVQLRAQRYLGHNPAGGAMILAMLAGLILTSVTGLLVYGITEAADETLYEVLEELHEFAANLTLFLVFFHVAGVIVAGVIHRENLIRAMWTGCKPRSLPE